MKIIISPSKTQNPKKSIYLLDKEPLYPSNHNKILSILKKFTKDDLKKIMNINNKLLDNTYYNIHNAANLVTSHAFESFNGLVYKGLNKTNYHTKEYEYIETHLRILDAFYGILEPGTLIKSYRLDLKMKIGINLYQLWDINNYFKNELIINLASSEFSMMINVPNTLNISFLQFKNNSYVNQATYSKQARGLFLNYLIIKQISTINEMRKFNVSNYEYNTKLSDKLNMVFTRTI